MGNEPLDQLYAVVFANPENGTPDNITQAGCLALARLGKEAWNAWRLKYPARQRTEKYTIIWENISDFRGIEFTEKESNFEDFIFDRADFSNCNFVHDKSDINIFDDLSQSNSCPPGTIGAIFNQAKFRNGVNFSDSNFFIPIKFLNAEIFGYANFYKATFEYHAFFIDTKFDGIASFKSAKFSHGAYFDKARFEKKAYFHNAEFGSIEFKKRITATFIDAFFAGETEFNGAHFNEITEFFGAQFDDKVFFDGAVFKGLVSFNEIPSHIKREWYKNEQFGLSFPDNEAASNPDTKPDLKPCSFKIVSFAGVNFNDKVDFTGCIFKGATSFGRLTKDIKTFDYDATGERVEKILPKNKQVTFAKAPLFHNCKLHQDTTFDDVNDDEKFPPPSHDPIENDTAARAYRTLKLAFSQHQATREEQLFFRLEMAEEAARNKGGEKWLFCCYKKLSNYGFGFKEPTITLIISWLIFWGCYAALSNLTLCFSIDSSCKLNAELIQFTLLQSLPLPGLDKWSDTLRLCLFPSEGWSIAFTIAIMLHKAVSLLAVFLFGLALRNLFKMK